MELDRAIEFALDGDALLFTGAGFSLGAQNVNGSSFKSAASLAAHFSRIADIPQNSSLEDAAEEIAEKFGKDKLIEELQLEYTTKEIQTAQETVARVPWRRVYTTNYDDVLEVAYRSVGRKLIPVTINSKIENIPLNNKRKTICIHFNGYICNITRDPKSAIDFVQTGSWAHVGPKNSPNRYKIIPA